MTCGDVKFWNPFSLEGHQPTKKKLSSMAPLLACVGQVQIISYEFLLIYHLVMLPLYTSESAQFLFYIS